MSPLENKVQVRVLNGLVNTQAAQKLLGSPGKTDVVQGKAHYQEQGFQAGLGHLWASRMQETPAARQELPAARQELGSERSRVPREKRRSCPGTSLTS